ncbi:MAG: hypothetical protein K2M48_01115, partial [Clostridiales bacterium]|nr:hypothetical protein [Clostridiales bacterium]
GGFNVHKPEEGEDPPATDALEIERNELYADIMNLNYASGSKYTVDLHTGVITENDNAVILNSSDYEVTGFDQAIAAIIEYNNKIGASIKKEAGTLSSADADKLEEYDGIYRNIFSAMLGDGLVTAVGNYKRMLSAEDFGTHKEQGMVDGINEEIQGYYNTIVAALDSLKIEYAKFDLFIADAEVGALNIPEYPEVILDHIAEEEPEAELALAA